MPKIFYTSLLPTQEEIKMNYQSVFWKLALGLLCTSSMMLTPVFAGDCTLKEAASFESCKDKKVKASGSRVGMFDVPEYFMFADPSFMGGEELQDYMVVDGIQVILHTKEEIQCPEKIEVKGTLKQIELEGNKTWVISVEKFQCL
jgi:hypothetical protein